jgi:hypothetical protein
MAETTVNQPIDSFAPAIKKCYRRNAFAGNTPIQRCHRRIEYYPAARALP